MKKYGGRRFHTPVKTCAFDWLLFPDANVNPMKIQPAARLRPMTLWWLWVLDAGLVSAGLLLLLSTQYGTVEFLGRACAMALLPLIPVLVLVGGAGSTIFALTKVFAERRGLKTPATVALIVGPAVIVAAALAIFGTTRSPLHRLNYLCAGRAPVADQVQLTGYSTFLREDWLATFHTDEKAFQTFVTGAKLAPAEGFEFQKLLTASPLNATRLGRNLPPLANAQFFQRIFKPEEHQRGRIVAVFNPATQTAVVLRAFRD
jgi:hypothetical protein